MVSKEFQPAIGEEKVNAKKLIFIKKKKEYFFHPSCEVWNELNRDWKKKKGEKVRDMSYIEYCNKEIKRGIKNKKNKKKMKENSKKKVIPFPYC